MRPKTPHPGARHVRIQSAIDITDANRRTVKIEPSLYLAEDVDDKVVLFPPDGRGNPVVVVSALTFEGLLRRRDAVYLSW